MLLGLSSIVVGLLLPVAPPTSKSARVVFVVSDDRSPFGATSPKPSPTWSEVASHVADRLPGFDERISAMVVGEEELAHSRLDGDIILALGLSAAAVPTLQTATWNARGLCEWAKFSRMLRAAKRQGVDTLLIQEHMWSGGKKLMAAAMRARRRIRSFRRAERNGQGWNGDSD